MASEINIKQIGPYQLLAVLGAGGMGTVYLGLHRGIGGFEKKVAIKCILPQVADDKSFINMLVDEAKLTAQLTHPNIVQVMDLAHSDGLHYLVMEYVDGVDARTIADMNELPLDEAAFLIAEAARGLAYAHRKCGADGSALGIVHRDISGHNLLVSSEGSTKVLDFGIAKASSNRNATQVGMLKGKLSYMSPEQATGKNLDSRSDLFSLGIVLWELCTRHRLFEGDTDIKVLLKVQQCEVEPPGRFVQGFPRDLENIIMKCLSPSPEQRYADGDRLADDLTEFLRTHQGATPPRVRLAQRVSDYLRAHPLKPIASSEKTVVGKPGSNRAPKNLDPDRTMAGLSDDQTRIVAAKSDGKPRAKSKRVLALILGFLVVAGGAGLKLLQNSMNPAPLVAPESIVVTAPIQASAELTQASVAPNVVMPAQPVTTAAAAHVVTPEVSQAVPVRIENPIEKAMVKSSPPKTVHDTQPRAVQPARERVIQEKKVENPVSVNPSAQNGAVGEGLLSLNATPWARVYINGKSVAESTPLLRYKLASGTHKVVLVNPELGIRKEISISVGEGEHVKQKVNLE